MSERNDDRVLPFAWGDWNQNDTFSFGFSDVVFRQFGEIEEGTHFDDVSVDFEAGRIDCYEGEAVVRSEEFVLAPRETEEGH